MRRLTVSLAAGLAVCLAAASGFGATTIDQIRVRGDNTSAEFDLFNPFTCADGVSSGGLATQILVFAFSSANKTSGPPTTSQMRSATLSGAAAFNGVNLLPFAQNVELQTQSTGELQLTRM